MVRYFRYNAIRLFRIRAASERIARGFALGMIINFLPTFGFGVLISGFFARAFGGHAIAGLIGGASLTFALPILFFFNIRAGNFLLQAEPPVDDAGNMTDQAMDKLVWGRAFMLGMIANMMSAGACVYLVIRLLYRRVRPCSAAGLIIDRQDWPRGAEASQLLRTPPESGCRCPAPSSRGRRG